MKLFRTISSILLAMLVLLSSTSFIVGMHICMGEVQNVAIFEKAEGCAMEKQLPPCHRHAKAPCCEDELVVHNGDELKLLELLALSSVLPIELQSAFALYSEIIPAGIA